MIESEKLLQNKIKKAAIKKVTVKNCNQRCVYENILIAKKPRIKIDKSTDKVHNNSISENGFNQEATV